MHLKNVFRYTVRGNWKEVDPQILRSSVCITFLDRKGFRFYLHNPNRRHSQSNPVGSRGNIVLQVFDHLNRNFDGLPFHATFNRSQRAAIVRFLKYLRYNAGWSSETMAEKVCYAKFKSEPKPTHTAFRNLSASGYPDDFALPRSTCR